MKRQSPHSNRAGFTLVEMLIVIAIIGILAGLTIPAVVGALRHAKEAAVAVEINQLDTACKAYKEKYGEYPPDFAGHRTPTWRTSAEQAVLRHLQRAFPRYQPGISAVKTSGGYQYPLGSWPGLRSDVRGNMPTDPWYDSSLVQYEGWGIDIGEFISRTPSVTPSTALTFWLGGKPDWRIRGDGSRILPGQPGFDSNTPVRGFRGFSANPLNPFDNSTSRVRPFYDFDLASLGWVQLPTSGNIPGMNGIACWPKVQAVTNKANGTQIIYFRAENGQYTVDGALPVKADDPANTSIKNESGGAWGVQALWPAIDTRLCGGMNATTQVPNSFTWMKPSEFQIFSSGADLKYARLWDANVKPAPPGPGPCCCLAFPTGENYWNDPLTGGSSYDDITNFSDGRLDSKLP
jgi:prepilin-type N-terminal cleavage/methylation domain-containing protein